MYLLDSDYIIYFLQGKKEFVSVVKNLPGTLYISVVSVGEIMEGLQGERHKKKLEVFKIFLKTVTVLSVDQNIAFKFATVRRDLRVTGKLIGDLDSLIAATCLINNLTLVTNNKKHFSRIKTLKVL